MTSLERRIENSYRYKYKDNKRHLRYAKFYFKSIPFISLVIEWFIYKYHRNRYKRKFPKNWYFQGPDGVKCTPSYDYYAISVYNNRKQHIKPLKEKKIKEIKNGARQTYVYWTESELKKEYNSRWEVPINKDWKFLNSEGKETTLELIYK